MNRRDFLVRTASLGAAAGLLARSSAHAQTPPASPAAAAAPAAPVFMPLRRGTGFFFARGGTIGWLVNDAAVACIDTQFPETATQFLEQLPGRAGRTLDVVVNTHHHGDHTGGNLTLRPATKRIVAHANVPDLLRARAEADKRPLDPAMLPDETFRDTWSVALGDETLSARYFGPAHTRGDIVLTFEKANVVHLGDLMFNRRIPVIDRPGGASIRGWIGVLEKIAADYPADALYVYGHANAKYSVQGVRGDLLVFRDYLSALLAYVERERAAGKPKETIVALQRLPGFEDYDEARRLPSNLSVAYDELAAPTPSA